MEEIINGINTKKNHTKLYNIGSNTHAQIDTHLALTSLNSHGSTATADINFATYKAIALACDNGATLPTSPAPVTGQWFLHTPTGRKVLMMYDGSAWQPIWNMGAATMYVDPTGTDSQNKGYGTGANAFATIQFAVNQIAGLVGGNVIINVAGGTYTENVVIQGKAFTGTYHIKLIGAVATVLAEIQNANITSNTTIGKSTASWTVNAYAKKMVRLSGGTGAGKIGIIQSNTATTLTIYGSWDRLNSFLDTSINATQPDATTDFIIEDWATSIVGSISVLAGQKSVIIKTIAASPASGNCIYADNGSQVESYANHIKYIFRIQGFSQGYCIANLGDTNFTFLFFSQSEGTVYGTYTYGGNRGALAQYGSKVVFRGSTFNNSVNSGIEISQGSFALFETATGRTCTMNNNGGYGCKILSKGDGDDVTTQNYSGNTLGTYLIDTATYGTGT